jgi:Ca2+-dependent lipid-binding protein
MDLDFFMAESAEHSESTVKSGTSMHMLLELRLGGKNIGGVTLPVLVDGISLRGKLRANLGLTSVAPFLKEGKFSFLAPPELTFRVKPLRMVNVMSVS